MLKPWVAKEEERTGMWLDLLGQSEKAIAKLLARSRKRPRKRRKRKSQKSLRRRRRMLMTGHL